MGIALYGDFENVGLVNVVIIIALLIFAKKAPELIKELFPKGGAASLGYGLRTPKKLIDEMFAGKQIWNTTKRAYGAAAVGFLAGSRATRKGLGKLWDLGSQHKSVKAQKEEVRKLYNDGKIDAKEADRRLNDIDIANKKFYKDFGKQLWRTTAGSLYTGLGGARRGMMTTNRSGRKTATDNAYKKVQSTYKLRDAGYSWGQQQADNVRGFFERDREIEDIIAANEAAIHALNTQLMEEEKNNKTGYTVQESKRKEQTYLIIGPNGKPLDGGKFYTRDEAESILGKNAKIVFAPADTQSQIGKLQAHNSALKFEEQKSNSNN